MNLIVLAFILIITVAQFGVHIKVEKGVDLVPVEIVNSPSGTVRVGSKFVPRTDRFVSLSYVKYPQRKFWMPASVVFGRAGDDDINEMIKDGVSVKRNVFLDTNTRKIIGVTKRGKSILSLYYHNSKLFRYGIGILIIVDIFMGLLMKHVNTKRQSAIMAAPEQDVTKSEDN